MTESLTDFVERIVEEQPETLPVEALSHVRPHPWVTRHGHGKRSRIRMHLGGVVKYERRDEDDAWSRVDRWTMGAAL